MSKIAVRLAVIVIVGLITAASSRGSVNAAATPFTVPLSGAQQVPPVRTTGSGTAEITYDPSTRVVTWSVAYSGLLSPVTMAHFHGPAGPGQNAKVQVWLTKRGGPVSTPIKGQATLNPDQAKQFMAGKLYINVHTQTHPDGEIRGQVTPPKS